MKFKKIKNNNLKKSLILILLLAVPIYILYIDNINHETLLKKSIKETYSDYINVCKNGAVPQFYNVDEYEGENIPNINSIPQCIQKCEESKDPSCNLMIFDKREEISDKCTIYNIGSDIDVNCATKEDIIIQEEDKYTYNGIGLVKPSFYKENKDKFKHIDYSLDKINNIKSEITNIQSNMENDRQDDYDRQQIYGRFYKNIKDLANYLELDKNFIYTYFINPDYSDSEIVNGEELDINLNKYILDPSGDISLNNIDISYIQGIKTIGRNIDAGENYDAHIENEKLEYNRRYLIYSILLILTIITIILLIFFKFVPNLISNLVMFTYFIGITLLVLFIHFYLKQ